MYDIKVEKWENFIKLRPNAAINEANGEDLTYVFEAEWLMSADLSFEDTGQGFYDLVDSSSMKYYHLTDYSKNWITDLFNWKEVVCNLLWLVKYDSNIQEYRSVV